MPRCRPICRYIEAGLACVHLRTQVCQRGWGYGVEGGLAPWKAAPVVPEHGRRHAVRHGPGERQERRQVLLVGIMQWVQVHTRGSLKTHCKTMLQCCSPAIQRCTNLVLAPDVVEQPRVVCHWSHEEDQNLQTAAAVSFAPKQLHTAVWEARCGQAALSHTGAGPALPYLRQLFGEGAAVQAAAVRLQQRAQGRADEGLNGSRGTAWRLLVTQ